MSVKLQQLVEAEMELYMEGLYADSKSAQWSLEDFSKEVVKLCAEHILNSSDRHRREYFAESLLENFGVE